jgi:crotonobetaine/carnitine-CoA ligase
MNALFYSVAGTVAAGASMIIVPKFSASGFWQTAVEAGATHANIIEAIGAILVARPRSEFRAEHRIRAVYGVRPRFVETFRRDFGIQNLISGYGMTEIPGVISWAHDVPGKSGSMGRPGAHPDPSRPWAQCRVIREDGEEAEANETGELWVKTPVIMQGYFRDAAQTRSTFEGDWFKTGDLVRRDEEGWFYFVSRKKDIIRRRGENIAALELERVIGEHPDVYEAAALGVSSELGEDEILVAVVAKKGRTPGAHSIADWCRVRLAANKVPRFVLFLDKLPHTPTHKIAKAVLLRDESLKLRATDLQSEKQGPLVGAQPRSAP